MTEPALCPFTKFQSQCWKERCTMYVYTYGVSSEEKQLDMEPKSKRCALLIASVRILIDSVESVKSVELTPDLQSKIIPALDMRYKEEKQKKEKEDLVKEQNRRFAPIIIEAIRPMVGEGKQLPVPYIDGEKSERLF